ncbi:MAG: Eco57I restriction-modification methylase domain-containing protein [Candidatus Lokiarchaeota archaeon]|nr:Eco57I restriction-modification methylase domain-containing protein [Candidatus Lokiarchaeota archaeon]
MNELSPQEFLSYLEKVILDFENEKVNRKTNSKSLGVIYTPKPLVNYIVLKVLKMYLNEFFNLPNSSTVDSYFADLQYLLSKNNNLRNQLIEKLTTIKILDPACGSGRFLISIAKIIYKFFRILNPGLDDFEIKKNIIQNNLHGIEIENSAYIITKLRLCHWLYSENTLNLTLPKLTNISVHLEEIHEIIHFLGIQFNLFNLDFLLEFDSKKFDIILGNPPYVENKKIKNVKFKKELTKRFKSAYRLFDLSVVFIERALELLKEHEGFLSMITTNKFLAADYGIQIRQLLLNNTELKEIINISSFPIFSRTAVYPIIITFKKSLRNNSNMIVIKRYQKMNDLNDDSKIKSQFLPQKLIKKIPAFVIPISGQINLINYLYKNFKPFSEAISDLKIIYRPYGFINWSKHLNNISNNPTSKKDLLLIGTGNVGKYHIKFDKPIKIAKRTIPISYFKYKKEFEDNWQKIMSPKLIFREVARELTWVYDPGIYTNVTGLYFVKIQTFNKDKLFSLLAIMNSILMDIIFKTLFSSLHMAGGYLRFNGSFIRRLPMPQSFPSILSYFGKSLHFLSQLQYDIQTDNKFKTVDIQSLKEGLQDEITSLIQTSNKITNSLVSLLYLDMLYLASNKDFYELREFLNIENVSDKIQIKYLLPRFQLEKYNLYSVEEIELNLNEIKKFLNQILQNEVLLKQIDEIISFSFH